MVTSIGLNLLLAFVYASVIPLVQSQEFQPIRAGLGGYTYGLHRRAPQVSDLDLLNDATFLWNDPSTRT